MSAMSRMFSRLFSPMLRRCLLAALLGLPLVVLAEGIKVTYPADEIPNDPRFKDVIEMLHTALVKTQAKYGPFELGPHSIVLPKARLFLEMESTHSAINILWNATSIDLEQHLVPIRIPLRKGLLGYRIAMITKENQSKIDQIKTVGDLKKITIGSGVGWADNAVYEAHGIEVMKAKYQNLHRMLSLHRFDLFPRGVGEIFAEYDQNIAESPNLAVEKNLLIYYPFPYYFFFNPSDMALKERVEAGLRIMIKDGSFDAIFKKYYQPAIEKANLKSRRVIRLNNPWLSKETPLHDASLWYDPTK